MDPASLYAQLGHHIAEAPDLAMAGPIPIDTIRWLGKAHALAGRCHNGIIHGLELRTHTNNLNNGISTRSFEATAIMMTLYRALSEAELEAPASAQGAFIPAGNVHDAMSAVGKVLDTVTSDVLIIDPYMDEKALSDFAILLAPNRSLRLLADQDHVKPTLKPAVARWASQHKTNRPVEARLAPSRSLHDRTILVDGKTAWVLTQSLNAFAQRSPASIVRTDPETAAMKVAAYDVIWQQAKSIS